MERLRDAVARVTGSGIVYVPTRRAAEESAQWLRDAGYTAQPYHAGLSRSVRESAHRGFADGDLPIVVATSAFGMGIDKPDVRWIFHAALPESPDAYVHEIGRAGRDGDPATTLLLYREQDTGLRRYFASGSLKPEQVSAVAHAVREGDASRRVLAERAGVGSRRLTEILVLLEQVGAVRKKARRLSCPSSGPDPEAAADLVMEQVERQQAIRQSRLDMMNQYAQTEACRGQYLLSYFGEQLDDVCGHCDNCASGSSADYQTDQTVYPLNSVVHHDEWGRGIVLRYEPDRVVVLFDDVGYRTLSLPDVVERDLLTQ
jgi:ATP-dependent DNA helicase RecQ